MDRNGDQEMTQRPLRADTSAVAITRSKPFRFATSQFTATSAKAFAESARRIEALG